MDAAGVDCERLLLDAGIDGEDCELELELLLGDGIDGELCELLLDAEGMDGMLAEDEL